MTDFIKEDKPISCLDCKHCLEECGELYCTKDIHNPAFATVNPITGEVSKIAASYHFCRATRNFILDCGIKAKWFKPKAETRMQKLSEAIKRFLGRK